MKTHYLVLLSVLFLVSCGQQSKNKIEASDAKEAARAEGLKLSVNTSASTIHWTGFKPGGHHVGVLGIKNGELYVEGTTLKSGTFTLDMNAIICEDLKDTKSNQQLVGHLKSADFFDVEKYPEGKFTITGVEELSKGTDSLNLKISGNLELKETSKNISFDATIKKDGDNYIATTAPFSIDRTHWGVNYGSKNIFKDLKDSFINDDIEIRLVIIAN
ncbi:MAG: YceI family protein [Dysgonamonadaceae bacterium]|jgi:hypothetical protein|nr:YceI family protein [Dysgonamonadaceae bacterium]